MIPNLNIGSTLVRSRFKNIQNRTLKVTFSFRIFSNSLASGFQIVDRKQMSWHYLLGFIFCVTDKNFISKQSHILESFFLVGVARGRSHKVGRTAVSVMPFFREAFFWHKSWA